MTAHDNVGHANVDCWWFRSFEDHNYLICLTVGAPHTTRRGAVLFARAVVDDFGTLVVVREFR